MIVRIIGRGQWDISDEYLDRLNRIDDLIAKAVDARDNDEVASLLNEMVMFIMRYGTRLEEGLPLSDVIIPSPDLRLEDVRDWLAENRAEDGFFPG